MAKYSSPPTQKAIFLHSTSHNEAWNRSVSSADRVLKGTRVIERQLLGIEGAVGMSSNSDSSHSGLEYRMAKYPFPPTEKAAFLRHMSLYKT